MRPNKAICSLLSLSGPDASLPSRETFFRAVRRPSWHALGFAIAALKALYTMPVKKKRGKIYLSRFSQGRISIMAFSTRRFTSRPMAPLGVPFMTKTSTVWLIGS